MKIGDEVFVHGYVDEIRKDTVIIRNNGGYFGTTEDEVTTMEKDDFVIPITNVEARNLIIDMSPTEIRISFEEDKDE